MVHSAQGAAQGSAPSCSPSCDTCAEKKTSSAKRRYRCWRTASASTPACAATPTENSPVRTKYVVIVVQAPVMLPWDNPGCSGPHSLTWALWSTGNVDSYLRADGNGPEHHEADGHGPVHHEEEERGPEHQEADGHGPEHHEADGHGLEQVGQHAGHGPEHHDANGHGPEHLEAIGHGLEQDGQHDTHGAEQYKHDEQDGQRGVHGAGKDGQHDGHGPQQDDQHDGHEFMKDGQQVLSTGTFSRNGWGDSKRAMEEADDGYGELSSQRYQELLARKESLIDQIIDAEDMDAPPDEIERLNLELQDTIAELGLSSQRYQELLAHKESLIDQIIDAEDMDAPSDEIERLNLEHQDTIAELDLANGPHDAASNTTCHAHEDPPGSKSAVLS